MALSRRMRRLIWFVAIWAASVALAFALTQLLRWLLAPLLR